MARVFIDVNLFGETWFGPILQELRNAENVKFVYSPVHKLVSEHERALKAKQFYKLMGEINKRDDVDASEVQLRIDYLESLEQWTNERDCDDPHIFALVYVKPTKYVFSTDTDIANCRRCINRVVNSRYCDFLVISNDATYRSHRPRVVA